MKTAPTLVLLAVIVAVLPGQRGPTQEVPQGGQQRFTPDPREDGPTVGPADMRFWKEVPDEQLRDKLYELLDPVRAFRRDKVESDDAGQVVAGLARFRLDNDPLAYSLGMGFRIAPYQCSQ